MNSNLDVREANPLSFTQALAAWQSSIGADRVIIDEEQLRMANRATYATSSNCIAILEPASRDEVAACMQIANQARIPVHPVSTGCNWGYGSRVPVKDGSVLISLERLDRILDFDEDLAYVTIEPGVTFHNLAAFLNEAGSSLMPPTTGSSPQASLVGNVLQRGIGKGLYEDMASHSCAYEAVLPNGDVVELESRSRPGDLGFIGVNGGSGPELQGLFQQSNLGVVTRMTFSLEPAPAFRQRVFFCLSDENSLGCAADVLRPFLMRNIQRIQVEMMNDYRFLMQSRQFPFEEFSGDSALQRSWVTVALDSANWRWIGCATIWGQSEEDLAVARRLFVAKMQPLVREWSVEEPTPGRNVVSLTQTGLRIAYWRKQQAIPSEADPDGDRCGVLWFSPRLPMVGGVLASYLKEMEDTILSHNLEPSVSLRFFRGRFVIALIGLFFERNQAGVDEAVISCYDDVVNRSLSQGYHPYRMTTRDMCKSPSVDDEKHRLLQMVKTIVDPKGILAPGYYIG